MASIIAAGTTSGTSLNLSADTSGVLQLATNGTTTAVTIDTSQNVGIGTASPTNKLHVQSANSEAINISDSAAGGNAQIKFTGSRTYQVGVGNASSGFAGVLYFYDATTAAERMRIPATGGLQVVNSISVGNATPTTSGAGITFPATQSASSDANTLDDYEEGDWTPTWVVASGSITANSSTSGKYVKIGRTVYIWGYISYQSNSSASGAVKVGGLPFSSGSGFGQFSNRSGGVYTIENSLFTSNSPNFGRIGNGSTEITPFISTATGSTNLSFSDFNTGASNYDQFVFAGQYLV